MTTAEIVRIPHLDVDTELPVKPGQSFTVAVYLDKTPSRAGENAEPFELRDPPADEEIAVDVWLTSTSHFSIDGSATDVIVLRRDEDASTRASFTVTVRDPVPADAGPPALRARFDFRLRASGSVRRDIPIMAGDNVIANPQPEPAAPDRLVLQAHAESTRSVDQHRSVTRIRRQLPGCHQDGASWRCHRRRRVGSQPGLGNLRSGDDGRIRCQEGDPAEPPPRTGRCGHGILQQFAETISGSVLAFGRRRHPTVDHTSVLRGAFRALGIDDSEPTFGRRPVSAASAAGSPMRDRPVARARTTSVPGRLFRCRTAWSLHPRTTPHWRRQAPSAI